MSEVQNYAHSVVSNKIYPSDTCEGEDNGVNATAFWSLGAIAPITQWMTVAIIYAFPFPSLFPLPPLRSRSP